MDWPSVVEEGWDWDSRQLMDEEERRRNKGFCVATAICYFAFCSIRNMSSTNSLEC